MATALDSLVTKLAKRLSRKDYATLTDVLDRALNHVAQPLVLAIGTEVLHMTNPQAVEGAISTVFHVAVQLDGTIEYYTDLGVFSRTDLVVYAATTPESLSYAFEYLFVPDYPHSTSPEVSDHTDDDVRCYLYI